MPSVYNEGLLTGEFLVSEGKGAISREAIVVAAGVALPSGQILGTLTASGKYAPYDNAADTGAEVATAILYAPLAASDADRKAVGIVRLAEATQSLLTGCDAAAKADLAGKFVIVRR